jgi:hypothetical protein
VIDEINQLRIEVATLRAELSEIVQALDVPGVDSVVTKAGAVLHLRTRLRGAEDEAQSLRDRVAKLVKDRTCLRAKAKRLTASVEKLARFWIPVTEALPPLEVPVWLIDKDKNIWIGARSDSEDGWLWGRCYDGWYYSKGRWLTSRVETDEDYRPAHWAHLPQPPEKE